MYNSVLLSRVGIDHVHIHEGVYVCVLCGKYDYMEAFCHLFKMCVQFVSDVNEV